MNLHTMKSIYQKRIGLPLLLLAGTWIAPLSAQVAVPDGQVTALTALNRVNSRYGAQFVQKIVEMRGVRGQSQPEGWLLIAHDPMSETLLREFSIGGRRVSNEGSNEDYYPQRQPSGFIDLQRLKLDSTEAFKILDREAALAKVGFDSIDYHLRCREFSDEPIWSVTARDASGFPVARVDLSAETGRVLRTIWSSRNGRRFPLIRDSALQGQPVEGELRSEGTTRVLPEGEVIGPAIRKEPVVPAPIDPGGIDPGTEVPEVERIDPVVPVPEEP